MSRISGSAMAKAIVDLRRTNFFIVMRRGPTASSTRLTASAIRCCSFCLPYGRFARTGDTIAGRRRPQRYLDLRTSGAHEAFEFRCGPTDRFVDGLAALGALGDHLGHGRLGVHLVG